MPGLRPSSQSAIKCSSRSACAGIVSGRRLVGESHPMRGRHLCPVLWCPPEGKVLVVPTSARMPKRQTASHFGPVTTKLCRMVIAFTEGAYCQSAAYPEARVEVGDAGVTLHPARPPVARLAVG